MKYKAIVSYKGRAYFGFQRQSTLPTIQGTIEEILSFLLGETTLIKGAGRTDAGVNALGQVICFSSPKEIEITKFLGAVNRLLPNDISFCSLETVNEDFDPRHSAALKKYRYCISLGDKDPLRCDEEWQLLNRKFSLSAYKKALSLFVGCHDFKNFTTKSQDIKSFIRVVDSITVSKEDGLVVAEFIGNGFMTYMVRLMVGAAAKVGFGSLPLSYIEEKLSMKNRLISSFKAPAAGLTLLEVKY